MYVTDFSQPGFADDVSPLRGMALALEWYQEEVGVTETPAMMRKALSLLSHDWRLVTRYELEALEWGGLALATWVPTADGQGAQKWGVTKRGQAYLEATAEAYA